MLVQNTVEKWELSLKEYQEGKWGTALNGFKAPNSLIKRFRISEVTDSIGNIYNSKFVVDVKSIADMDWTKVDITYTITTNSIIELFEYDPTSLSFKNKLDKDGKRVTMLSDSNERFDVDKAFSELSQTYINAIVSGTDVLRSIEFSVLPEVMKQSVRFAIYNAIEYAVLNKHIWEKVNTSGISTPSFSVNVDTTNWLLSSDKFGGKAWDYLTSSGLLDLRIVGDAFMGKLVAGDDDFTVIKQWDTTTLNNHINRFDYDSSKYKTIDVAKATINSFVINTDIFKAYDYFTLHDEFNSIQDSTWRYIGGLVNEESSWERVDTKSIGGKKYLVWDNYVLAGSGGLRGTDGKDGEKGDKGDRGEKGGSGLPGRDGKPGTNGTNGKDGVDGLDLDVLTLPADLYYQTVQAEKAELVSTPSITVTYKDKTATDSARFEFESVVAPGGGTTGPNPWLSIVNPGDPFESRVWTDADIGSKIKVTWDNDSVTITFVIKYEGKISAVLPEFGYSSQVTIINLEDLSNFNELNRITKFEIKKEV